MFQSFRLTEYVIINGASLQTVLNILAFLAISFLPVILPMSLLFAVLITYGRLSSDSEIVAFKSLGLTILHLTLPAIILGLFVTVISYQTAYYIAPWGNRKMEILIHQISQQKPESIIKGGVFSEGFFDMVIYANYVEPKTNKMNHVFIYDERNSKSPMTIIAKEGEIIQQTNMAGQKAFLRLFNGDIHRTQNEVYTKISFKTFDITLFDPIKQTEKGKTPLSYNLNDLKDVLFIDKGKREKLEPKFIRKLEIEYHRRSALAFTCLIFAVVGVGLGTTTNKRSGKGSGFVLSIIVVISFWLIYAAMESLATSQKIPIPFAMWVANFLFGTLGIYKIYMARN